MKTAAFKIGDVFPSQNCGHFEILSRTKGKALVRFLSTGYITVVEKGAVRKGLIKDNLHPSIYGLGFYGDGSYTKNLEQSLLSKVSETWHSMFKRCYSDSVHENHEPYSNCFVNKRWHDFQNFAKFYIECPYRQTGWQLDKDILVKGNKEYGPDTCCFVPVGINGYMKTNSNRRGDYPIGVKLSYLKNSYESRVRDFDGKQILLGKYATPELAFEAYKSTKENVIKQKAEFWKDQICPKVYHALLNFKVDITD